jgi:hypothetical protein
MIVPCLDVVDAHRSLARQAAGARRAPRDVDGRAACAELDR